MIIKYLSSISKINHKLSYQGKKNPQYIPKSGIYTIHKFKTTSNEI